MEEVFREQALTGEYVAEAMQRFARARPFPFVVLKRCIRPELLPRLIGGLTKEGLIEQRSDLFHFLQTTDLHGVKDTALAKFIRVLDGEACAAYFRRITGVRIRSGATDLFGSLYTDTHHLLCHDDQLEGRKLAFIVYLSTLSVRSGGALLLRGDQKGRPGAVMQRIRPCAGDVVLFAVSKKSWHEVQEVIGRMKRYALGGWFHAHA
jgi:prolyl 3-hydroxylase /prolyl 3,4-dihydroxylase